MRFSSAREAISTAYSPRVGSTWGTPEGGGKVDNCGRIWNGIQLGRVISVVERMDQAPRAWALWCYTDHDLHRYEMIILDWLCDQLDANPPVEYQHLGRMRRAMELLYMLMLDTRQRERNGRPLFTVTELADRVGVHRNQFERARYWGRFTAGANGHLAQLVSDSLEPVHQLIDDIRNSRAA